MQPAPTHRKRKKLNVLPSPEMEQAKSGLISCHKRLRWFYKDIWSRQSSTTIGMLRKAAPNPQCMPINFWQIGWRGPRRHQTPSCCPMVDRAQMNNLRQDHDESIQSFCPRAREQANFCNFNIPCPTCAYNVNYTDHVLCDVLNRDWLIMKYSSIYLQTKRRIRFWKK